MEVTKQTQVFWQLADSDRPVGEFFREGTGLSSLMKALREHVEEEAARTRTGYVPGANLSLYWHEVQAPDSDA